MFGRAGTLLMWGVYWSKVAINDDNNDDDDNKSGGRLCTLIGVPCHLSMLSTFSTFANVLFQNKSPRAEGVKTDSPPGYTYEGTQTTAWIKLPRRLWRNPGCPREFNQELNLLLQLYVCIYIYIYIHVYIYIYIHIYIYIYTFFLAALRGSHLSDATRLAHATSKWLFVGSPFSDPLFMDSKTIQIY